MAEHLELLKENKWTHKEFEAGFQEGVAPKDMSENFLKYEALLRRELAKGEVCRRVLPFLACLLKQAEWGAAARKLELMESFCWKGKEKQSRPFHSDRGECDNSEIDGRNPCRYYVYHTWICIRSFRGDADGVKGNGTAPLPDGCENRISVS